MAVEDQFKKTDSLVVFPYYKSFTKVGHIFLEQKYFSEVKDTGIRLFIFLDKKSITRETFSWREMIGLGFGATSIKQGFEALQNNKFIKDLGIKQIDKKYINRISIENLTEINTKYWNKKLKKNKPVFEESNHGQIPWILIDPSFYEGQTTGLRNKVPTLYLFFTKFFDPSTSSYHYTGNTTNIRNILGYNGATLKKCLSFMLDQEVISEDDKGIILNHASFMKLNERFFKSKEEKEEPTKATKTRTKKKTKTKEKNTETKAKKGVKLVNGAFYPYKNQKVTWKEATAKNLNNSHIYDEYVETGFMVMENRIPTAKEAITDINQIKRLLERNKWDRTYLRDLMRFVARDRGSDGFRFGLIERFHKQYSKHIEKEDTLKQTIAKENKKVSTTKSNEPTTKRTYKKTSSTSSARQKQDLEKITKLIRDNMARGVIISPKQIDRFRALGGTDAKIRKIFKHNEELKPKFSFTE